MSSSGVRRALRRAGGRTGRHGDSIGTGGRGGDGVAALLWGGGVGGLLSWHRVWGNGVNPAALGVCVCVRLMAPGAGGRDPPCFGGSLSWHLK